jgi:hypothetical protein
VTGFLITYNRQTADGSVQEFSGPGGPRRALEARLARERVRVDPNVEIVSINAESLDAVKRTHSRYFEGRMTTVA